MELTILLYDEWTILGAYIIFFLPKKKTKREEKNDIQKLLEQNLSVKII